MSFVRTRPEDSSGPSTDGSRQLRLFALDARSVGRLRRFLIVLWLLIAIEGVVSLALLHGSRAGTAGEIGRFLSLGLEQSPGTWVASVLLLTCALLAAVGALEARLSEPRWVGGWWLLAGVLLAMSFDEVADVHGQLSPPISRLLGDTSGFFTFAWIVPAVVFGITFLAVETPFLRHLGGTGHTLVVAGVVFVGGAVGLEMVEGQLDSRGDKETLAYDLFVLAEELMEFGAVMWVIVVLIEHLRGRLDDPQVIVLPHVRQADTGQSSGSGSVSSIASP